MLVVGFIDVEGKPELLLMNSCLNRLPLSNEINRVRVVVQSTNPYIQIGIVTRLAFSKRSQ